MIAKYIPDSATASAALEAGEIDWWDIPPADFVVRLEKNPKIEVFIKNPIGNQGWLRPNHLHPPFNNKKARQALVWMVDQEAYLQTIIGQPKYYKLCPAYFMCGGVPYETTAGAPRKPDLDRARQLLREGGYDGRPLVLLDPVDNPNLHGAALVTQQLLQKIGATVDLQAQDWATVIARRGKKDPPASGGWNLMPANWISADVMTPPHTGPRRLRQGGFGGRDSRARQAPRRLEARHRSGQAQADREQIRSCRTTGCRSAVGQYMHHGLPQACAACCDSATILWNVTLDA